MDGVLLFIIGVFNCLSTSITNLKHCKLDNRDEEGIVSLQCTTPDFFSAELSNNGNFKEVIRLGSRDISMIL